jgi:hypothetical protein
VCTWRGQGRPSTVTGYVPRATLPAARSTVNELRERERERFTVNESAAIRKRVRVGVCVCVMGSRRTVGSIKNVYPCSRR